MLDDDEDNPWRYMGTAKVGQPCELLVFVGFPFTDPIKLDVPYFLHDDGKWYCIGEPGILKIKPVAWRYKMVEVGT